MKRYFVVYVFMMVVGLFAHKGFKDPVCGMNLESETELKSEYKGMTYYFCSADCKAKFDKEPDKYAVKPEHKPISICCGLSEEMMKNVKVEKKETEKGLILTLTSSNPDVVKKLQENIGKCEMMEKKMEHMEHEECCMMHMKDVEVKIKNIKNGVQIELKSNNPEVIKELKRYSEKNPSEKEKHKH